MSILLRRLLLGVAIGAALIVGSTGRLEMPGRKALAQTTGVPHSEIAPNRLDRLVDSGSFTGGLGVNIHFDGHRPDEVANIAHAGFHLVRSDLLWAHVERVRGRYDWQQYDGLIADLQANHIVPTLILAYSNPLYAAPSMRHPGSDSLGYQAPIRGAARTAYLAFVRAAVQHYGSKVIWEIWNEPDQNFGDPVDLQSFVGFALDACRAVREVAQDAPVIGPAASGFVWWFLDALRKADSGGCFDAISVHPYRDEPPESVLRDWARAQATFADCALASRCPVLVDSEWGYSVSGGNWTERRQADFVSRIRLLDMMAGVKLTIIYDWQNDGPDPKDKEANFGLMNFANLPKPALHTLVDIGRDLAGLHYIGWIQTNRPDEFALAFGQGVIVRKLVTWSATGRSGSMRLVDLICGSALTPNETVGPDTSCGSASTIDRRVNFSGTPTVFNLDSATNATATTIFMR